MIKREKLKEDLLNGLFNSKIKELYCTDDDGTNFYIKRFLGLIDDFEKTFSPYENVALFSAPGRTEIGGNHTDHQHGCVLAGSVNLDVIAVASINNSDEIRVKSEGYPLDVIKLDEMEPDEKEFNQAKSLIRGIAAKIKSLGYKIKGFDCYTTSNVLKGSGLSSSAAFEVLIGNVINGLFCNNEINPVEIAKIGQFAENVYFGKPCGLMDQMASSVGGIIEIDFKNTENPKINKINFDFTQTGYALCIIDSGADHADLTDEYAAIPIEMKQVANAFGKEVLREVNKNEFLKSIPQIRKTIGDRAVLRAIHFFNENKRAEKEAELLSKGEFEKFLGLLKESGFSSYMYLQNVCVCGSKKEQAVGLTLSICEELLNNKGAYRVHGGGFAGTVQAFVPIDMLDEFKTEIESIVGKNSCHILSIRPIGGIQIA